MYVIASSRSQIIHAPEDHCGVKTTELVRLDKSSDIKKAFFFFMERFLGLGSGNAPHLGFNPDCHFFAVQITCLYLSLLTLKWE